ncbi:hypothetical protein AgCh_024389 [Apium graveolens]
MAIQNSTTSFDDIPEETASNILLRLPVKALIRSTSVNKKWYSLITNPLFISAQVKNATSHCDDNAALIIPPYLSQDKYCSLISAGTSKLIKKYEVPFTTKSDTLKLVGSVNGLMLLTDSTMRYNSRDLYLWNPLTKTHRTLVSTCFKNVLSNPYTSYGVVGLGFNSSSNDFRIVRIVYAADKNVNFFGEVAPRVEVYSLRKHTWKKIKDAVVPGLASNEGTYVNGSFYWKDIANSQEENDLWIMSFDFENEVFGELKVPRNVSNCMGATAKLWLMGFEGSLALCVFDAHQINGVASFPYHLWLMRQENDLISWTSRFSAARKEGGGWPLNITKAGTLILEVCPLWGRLDVKSIVSFNPMNMHLKDLGFSKNGAVETSILGPDSEFTVDTSFTESLVMYEGGKALVKFAK